MAPGWLWSLQEAGQESWPQPCSTSSNRPLMPAGYCLLRVMSLGDLASLVLVDGLGRGRTVSWWALNGRSGHGPMNQPWQGFIRGSRAELTLKYAFSFNLDQARLELHGNKGRWQREVRVGSSYISEGPPGGSCGSPTHLLCVNAAPPSRETAHTTTDYLAGLSASDAASPWNVRVFCQHCLIKSAPQSNR